jgi:acetoacetyl-CoA synthetase
LSAAASNEKPLWSPSPGRVAATDMAAFMRDAGERWNRRFGSYQELHDWSIAEPEQFWRSLWSHAKVAALTQGARGIADPDQMPGARFFPDARLNFAQNLLRRRDDTDALVFWGEDKVRRRMSWRELYDAASRLAQALRDTGVNKGDRVAAFVANMPETIVGMLAASSIGAIWSSCSPDFGVQGVLDRFGQIEPRVLLAVDGYHYNGKTVETLDRVAEIVRALPSVEKTVVLPYAGSMQIGGVPGAVAYADFVAAYAPRDIEFEQVEFNHPLYILYSSGTTGVPKCIVHGTGGTLLQHLKEQRLHCDVRAGDRLFYFTTCGWMMWNWLASGLASEATLLLYDGSPFIKRAGILWDFAEAERITHFGTSAKYIDAIAKINLKPRETHELSALRTVLSTGSPLSAESFDYVYSNIKEDLCLSSIAGGTDLIACFVLGSPILPVWRGEIQCKSLGMKVEVFDDAGKPVIGQKGELVCTAPFPSMPIGFWNDPGDRKYHAAYYEVYPNVWRHGDYVEITRHGGIVIYGRSDAVLNPGGVRIGTAEIYRQVEKLDEVVESLVIGQDWETDVRVVLFVKLKDGIELDDALVNRIKAQIRNTTTPRHVPAKVLAVPDIPRTKSGKIVELAVRDIVHGRPVRNQEALANPEALEWFRGRPELAA